MEWFKSLSNIWKVVVIVAALLVAIFLFDKANEYYRDAKDWMFDRGQAKIEKQNEEILAENAKLRAEAEADAKAAVEREAKLAVLDKDEKALDAREKKELEIMDKALEAQDAEEARTAEPTDAYTRCVRAKEKAIALGSKFAHKMACENVQ